MKKEGEKDALIGNTTYTKAYTKCLKKLFQQASGIFDKFIAKKQLTTLVDDSGPQ